MPFLLHMSAVSQWLKKDFKKILPVTWTFHKCLCKNLLEKANTWSICFRPRGDHQTCQNSQAQTSEGLGTHCLCWHQSDASGTEGAVITPEWPRNWRWLLPLHSTLSCKDQEPLLSPITLLSMSDLDSEFYLFFFFLLTEIFIEHIILSYSFKLNAFVNQ